MPEPSRQPSPSPAEGSTSHSLLERLRLRQVDEAAWERFIRVYTPLIFGRCRAAGLQPSDAEDVTQEVFQKVLRSVGRFERRHTSSFRGWLSQVTCNAVADHRRRQERCPPARGGDEALEELRNQPTRAPEEGEFSEAEVRSCALELIRGQFRGEDRTWQAFWRQAVDGVPASAVAQELGMSVSAVGVARFRVLKRLREACAGLLE